MTRSRKVEKAVKESGMLELQVVGQDWTDHPIEEFTNEGSDMFCPFIDNKKLARLICSKHGEGVIHRDAPAKLPWGFDPTKDNNKNRHYHWVQIGFNSYQCCKYDRDPVSTKEDLCEKYFKKCPIYKANIEKVKKC